MSAAISILWFLALCISSSLVFWTCGWSGIVNMFPEGYRWWMRPAQFGSLALFAAVVLHHPFAGAA